VLALVAVHRFFQLNSTSKALEHGLECAAQLLLADLRSPLRWIALLEGQVAADFAASGGVAQAPTW